MFGKKIFFLTAGYVAGNIVASIYKGKKKLSNKIKDKQDVKNIAENFLEIQKNFIHDIEKKFLSDSSREKLDETKEKFQKYASEYIKEGEKIVAEIKASETYQDTRKKGLSFYDRIKHSLDSFYNKTKKNKEEIEDQVDDASSRVLTAKKELTKKK